ncbi:MAG: imidazole glycerol phosphate synthase subunit HisH [Candidatus Margulisiibacteriota bacterium]
MSIAIIDYGAGNLRSVQKAFEKLGFDAILTKDKIAIRTAKGVVLPGVGSFDSAVTELRNSNLEGIIEEVIAMEKPFFGICLGYQLLFESSEEGKLKGFGILKGRVTKFNFSDTPFSGYSIPHMGWNRLLFKRHSPIFDDIPDSSMVYFAHSYYPVPEDESIVSAQTDYAILFASSIGKGNLFGVQFHPEKSGATGLKILENFGKLCLK